ncbi:MAG: hypothetical protein ABIG84_07465 [archaeon]
MDMLKIMNAKEKKEFLRQVEDLYGIDRSILKDHEYLSNSEKVWIASRNILKGNSARLTIEGVGMLFARISKDSGSIKLTTNAIQLFGRHMTKNILVLEKEDAQKYVRGLDISGLQQTGCAGYVVVKSGRDYLGCGLYKDGCLKNQIPKQRRIKKF